ncbi:MAG: MFS transporter [Acidilobus sp.]
MSPQEVEVYSVKFVRVLASAMVSVVTPIYLSSLGLGPLYIGLSVVLVVMGNVASNFVVGMLGGPRLRRSLMALSALTVISGLALFLLTQPPLVLAFLFMGNVSTTGTEAGPYQSIEASVLPLISDDPQRAYTLYNMLGYTASSLGSLAVSPIRELRVTYLALVASGSSMVALYSRLTLPPRRGQGGYFSSDRSRRTAMTLSTLFAVDAFAGGMISLSLLSYWLHVRFGAGLQQLGPLFSAALALTATSLALTYPLARMFGNLNVMVFSHLASNAFLVGLGLAPSFPAAAAALLARQSLSQMDVPTRQAFMAQIFPAEDLPSANSATNSARLVATLPSGVVVGALIAGGAVILPVLLAGLMKAAYDVTLYVLFRGPERGRDAEGSLPA